LRLAIYSDFSYRRHEGRVYAEQAFVIFLLGLEELVERLVFVGRLDPHALPWHFPLPFSVEYEPLAHYPRLDDPLRVLAALGGSMRSFWQVLDGVDTVWLFGPNPVAIVFAVLAKLRRRRVVLGVRQEYRSYVSNRHPNRPLLRVGALLLEAAFRLLGHSCQVIVVGPRLAEQYAGAKHLLAIGVTLVGESDLIADADSAASSGEKLAVLSVGRLDNEKNPLLLADVLVCLGGGDGGGGERDDREGDSDKAGWHLTICGEGPLAEPLRERLHARGVENRADLRGFVPAGPALYEIYRHSDFLLHTSLTEGVPQVLFEAFAAGLPVVATDVGAVAETVQDAALLVPPSDPEACADALRRLADDLGLRRRLIEAGLRIVRDHTREAQCRRVVEFIDPDRRVAH